MSPHVALLVETSLASGRGILRGIARYVRDHRPWSIYLEPRGLRESVPAWIAHWDGDGIIVRLQDAEIAEAVATTGLPAVDVLGVVRSPGIPLAHVDNRAIARLAAGHLVARGFRRFGYCGIAGINWSDERREAFLGAVEGRGECSVHTLVDAVGGWEAEQQELAAWVASLPRPCAIMACNDPVGQRVLEACRRVGARVPEDFAVVGVDDDEPICSLCDPPLSSVDADHEGVGYEAAALLERLMAGERLDRESVYVSPAGLTIRRSSDSYALADREVAQAIGLIRERSCDGLGVEDLCRELSMSRSTLQRRFRKQIGRTIHDEILRIRLDRAQDLLARTDLNLQAIAARSGLGGPEYLAAVFRAKLGQTPAAYRRSARRPGGDVSVRAGLAY